MSYLLQPHSIISMRPSTDKEMEAVDPDDLFDQYIQAELQLSTSMVETSSSDDLAHLFDFSTSNGGESWDMSAMPNWDATSEDAWHKALEAFKQNPASPPLLPNSSSIYRISTEKASQSVPDLLSFDDLFESDNAGPRLSTSTPTTPKTRTPPRPAKKATSNPERSTRHGVHKSAKKASTLSKMMRSSPFRANIQDLWSRKMHGPTDSFALQLPDSPPPSGKVFQDEITHGLYLHDQQPYTAPLSPLPDSTTPDVPQSNYQLTPLSSPAIDTNSRSDAASSFQFSNDGMANAYFSQPISSAALSALQTPPTSHRLQMSTWGPDTPASLDFAFSASPEYRSIQGKAQGWWSNGAATAPQPSTPTYHTTTTTTTQPRSRSQNQSLSFSSAGVSGLGISCDTSSFSNFGSDLTTAVSNTTTPNFPTQSFELSYTNMYPPTPGIPIGQPLHHSNSSNPPSRSPSSSPQPRFHRRRHSSNHSAAASRAAQRRKSSGGSSQHSHSHSHSHTAAKPANVGFVNFTPDDSRKILTGVAPSGSSKTKARREKEAADKRRKLSQAAVKAVIEAGGDLARLEEGGLLNLGHE